MTKAVRKKRKDLDTSLANKILSALDRTDPNARFDVKPLGGGVASTVLLVENGRFRHVLKQPLRKFRTRDEWIVETERVRQEFRIAKLIEKHMGIDEIVPVVALDEADEVLVMDAAEKSWTPWKSRLLQGEVRNDLGKAAATILARFHGLVRHMEGPEDFRNDLLFDQQRLDPYLRTSAQRVPEAAKALEELIAMFPQRSDLVHGDYSPKNLMTNGFNIRMIDHEVVTRGDAAFDLAFLVNHLLLKSVHLADHMEEFHELAWATFDTYMDRSPVVGEDFESRFVRFLGGVHLARAVGKSKAEYLTDEDKAIVARAGTRILTEGTRTLEGTIEAVREANRAVRLKAPERETTRT